MSDDEKLSSMSESDDVGETEALPDVDHTEIPPPHRAYIGGLSNKTRVPQLSEFLRKVDPDVSHVIIAKNKGEGNCRGFAHCSFSTPQLRQKAVGSLTGQTFLGRKIRIEEASEHFVAKRKREDEDGPLLKRSKKDIDTEDRERAAAAKKRQDEQWNNWNQNSWGNNNSWDDGGKVEQFGTQRRWEPGQPTAAPAPTGPPKSKRRIELEAKKAAAVANEDYAEAARLKKELEGEDVVDKLQEKKADAVKREDFAEAARIKAEIEALENGTAPPAPAAKASPKKPASPKASPKTKVASPKKIASPAKTAAKQPEPKKKAVVTTETTQNKGCKRCTMGKPCGKHSGAGNRCKKCASGEPCMKHKPEEAMIHKTKAAMEAAKAQKAAADAKPKSPSAPAKKPAKKAAAKPSTAPTTMEALLAQTSQSFVACMDDDI